MLNPGVHFNPSKNLLYVSFLRIFYGKTETLMLFWASITKAILQKYPDKPEAVIFWPFLQAIIGIYVQGKIFIEEQSGRRL